MPMIATSQNVDNNIKVDVEATENDQIVIFHPGSSYLRIGLSTSSQVIKILHCIARKIKQISHEPKQKIKRYEDNFFDRTHLEHTDSRYQRNEGLNSAASCLMMKWKEAKLNRKIMKLDQIVQWNSNSFFSLNDPALNKDQSNCNISNDGPDYLVGYEAITSLPNYNFHQPWRCAQLNVHSSTGGSISSIVQDLHDIWMHSLNTYFNINPLNIQTYRAILIIPDLFKRSQIKELVDLLLNKMGFASMFVVQESICCSFGDGSLTCCVVDVGHCKTSVCCIEDGLIKKHTLFTSCMGGSDVTKCYHWLLNKYGFPMKNINLIKNGRKDGQFIQQLKEQYCHLSDHRPTVEDHELTYPTSSSSSSVATSSALTSPSLLSSSSFLSSLSPLSSPSCKFRMSDERMLTPLCLFFPDMLGLKAVSGVHRSMIFGVEKSISDPTDYLDDDYLLQTTTKHEQAARLRKKETAENVNQSQEGSFTEEMQTNEYDAMDQSETSLKGGRADDDCDWSNIYESSLIGLHQLVIKSIDKCENEEIKQKMFSNILLVGGGAKFENIQSYFEYLLINQLVSVKSNVYDINIKLKNEELNIRGACIMSCLDTVQELWIDKYKWNKYSMRVLREKAPFLW